MGAWLRWAVLAALLTAGAADGPRLAAQLPPSRPLDLVAGDDVPVYVGGDAEASGFMADTVREAFRRIGVAVTIRTMPWARCLAAARDGRVDGVFAVSRTEDRGKFLLFPDEALAEETESAFARTGDDTAFAVSVETLERQRLGVVPGTTFGPAMDAALASKKFGKLDYARNIEGLLRMLAAHRVDVIAADRLEVLAEARKIGLQEGIRELSPPVLRDQTYVAFSRARDLADIGRRFSDALGAMKRDGTYAAIYDGYRLSR